MELAAGFGKFALLNGVTLLAAIGLASRLRLDSKAERLLAACVLAAGIANATALVLGVTGQLRFWPLLAAQVPFAALAAAVARWRVAVEFLDPRSALALLRGPALRTAAALLAIAYAYALFLGYITEAFAGDALMYHLPLLAEYAREGQIGIPDLGRYWCNRYWAYYPGGAYLLYQWFVLPFGTGLLVDIAQLPYAFAAALAAYVIALRVGAARRDAAWAAILFLAVPIVISQVKTALVDVTLTFLFAAGLAFLLARRLTAAHLLLGAIAWGAAPAVKLPAPVFIALGAVCVAAHQLDRGSRWRDAARVLGPVAGALAVGFLAFSGYWFGRNWWLTGSPTYPLNLNPGPPPVWTNILVYGALFPLLDFSPIVPDLFNYETGAGPQFICLAVPALIALFAASVRERRPGIAAAALLPFVAYAVWLLRLSTSVQTLLRYVLPAMPIGFAAFAWLLPRARRRGWLSGLALASVVFSVLVTVPRLGTYTDAASLRAGLAKWRRGEVKQRFELMGALDLQDYRRTWAYIETLPGAHSIAVAHMIFTYPLQGADFRHQIHFVDEFDRAKWLAELERRRVDLLTVAEFVDPRGTLTVGDDVRLELDYSPAGDEYVHAARRLDARPVRGLRVRYRVEGAENARLHLAVNRFAATWELPLPPPGEERVETVPWEGDLTSIELILDFAGRTTLRGLIATSISSLEVQGADGRWTELLDGDADGWEVLRWPVEYYWAEQLPDRFRLAFRDQDYWGDEFSGKVRVYRTGDDGENVGPTR